MLIDNPKILVIGGPSLDTITVKGTDHQTPGGAGLYTAFAAARCGADVTLLGPVPDPLPEELSFVSKKVQWIGPTTSPDQLPGFHIIHQAGETIYEKAFFGAESSLSISDLPLELSQFELVHIVPLGNIQKQLEFIHHCQANQVKTISASTGKMLMDKGYDDTIKVVNNSHLFFMNNEEASFYFDNDQPKTKTGKTMFVTKSENGASVLLGDHQIDIEPVPTNVLDPTGAGDTFCGATIAGIAKGEHPAKAAMGAATLASEMITGIGPAKLIEEHSSPTIQVNDRVVINKDLIQNIAVLISGLEEEKPFDFLASSLPEKTHPLTVDYFFVTTLQQFCFWNTQNERYHSPLIDKIGGETLKGAFYLFKAYTEILDKDPDYFSPKRQANQSLEEMKELFRSDNDDEVMPVVEMHLDAARRYGTSMLDLNWSPQMILDTSMRSSTPLRTFLMMLDHVGGYLEDPLRKKSALLAMILNNRPEQFLIFGEKESLPPVIDYHCMRANLRMGLIDVLDEELQQKLMGRKMVNADDEWDVRYAAYQAVEQLPLLSGRSMATVDQYFFFSRKRCPEMTEPDCDSCSADPVCAHRKELFQPIFRTDFY